MGRTLHQPKKGIQFDVITIFPDVIDAYCSVGVLGRAIQQRLITVRARQLREYAPDRHHTVDDRPYGGGPGMVMKPEPIIRALADSVGALPGREGRRIRAAQGARIILMAPRGRQLTQAAVRRMSRYRHVTLIAGRYEGVDERIVKFIDESVSIGPYILSGGELAALALIDAAARLLPGVLGNEESSAHESFSHPSYREHPHYTRPPVLVVNGARYAVPRVLTGGDHEKIAAWRTRRSGSPLI